MGKTMTMHGIFCLETIWFSERTNPSTRPLLELLERLSGIPFVYRDVSTQKELDFCLGRLCCRSTWKKDYQLDDMGILYLGFHGSPGTIYLRQDSPQRGDDDAIVLNEIGDSLAHKENKYNLNGCAVHFAACSVARSYAKVREFKERVGASCVSGYSKSVNSSESWAFELMYLNLLSDLMKRKNVNKGTLGTLAKKLETDGRYGGLADALGFKMFYD